MNEAELIFVRRMLPHFLAGISALEADESVLEDDFRLVSTVLSNSSPTIVGDFADARSFYSRAHELGKGLRSAISDEVYERLRT